MTDPALYEKILAFELDEAGSALTFTKRLARENGWSLEFAGRVVLEYRRFVYLAMVSPQPVTPSDEVDQAWHLHMLYTESYWSGLCEGVLGRELSHGPTKGGQSEGAKFTDWYGKTKELYRAEFGEEAPADVWPPSEVRFGLAPHFVRVNTAENFVVSKSVVRRYGLVGAAALLVLVAGCSSAIADASPGLDIALFFLVMILVVGVVVYVLIMILKKGGGGGGGSGGGTGCGSSCGTSSGDSSDSGCGSSGCGSGCGGGCGGCGS